MKFGLDYESLRKINPRLIYCSVTGFGQTGPYAPRAGYDYLVQGMGGLMDLNGEPDGEPQKAGVAVADIFTGLYGVTGILAALHRRGETGQGAHIDMALLDTQVSVLANQALNYLVSGEVPHRMGNAHPNIVPYQVFPAADGHLIVAVGNDGQFARFCAVLGEPGIALDPRHLHNADRVHNRDTLCRTLADLTARFARDDLLARLEGVGVPAAPINSIDQVFQDPQVIHRGLKAMLPEGGGGTVASVASPIVIDGVRMVAPASSPRLGADTASILATLDQGEGA